MDKSYSVEWEKTPDQYHTTHISTPIRNQISDVKSTSYNVPGCVVELNVETTATTRRYLRYLPTYSHTVARKEPKAMVYS